MVNAELNMVGRILEEIRTSESRNFHMPLTGRYQPRDLGGLLGYDQWAVWLVIVEFFWMKALGIVGVIRSEDAALLDEELLRRLMHSVTTTQQDARERGTDGAKGTGHDVIALQQLMRPILPEPLRQWLHFGATSYDIIDTAAALQAKCAFHWVIWPQLRVVDRLWRDRIRKNAAVVQSGRTHLQTALPVTVGFWLANLHNRFVNTAKGAWDMADRIQGKFSGAVGTRASQCVLMPGTEPERALMELLGLQVADVSTQIVPPESLARYYHELVLLSGALGNLGEDTRILQSSQYGELKTVGSTSSAMPHKSANPIAAEQLVGLHRSAVGEYVKVQTTLISDLQRDLCGSSVARGFSAIMAYVYQQLLTAQRLLTSMEVDEARCRKNFLVSGHLVVAELLHLILMRAGIPDTHRFVHETVVPQAAETGQNLYDVIMALPDGSENDRIKQVIREGQLTGYLIDPSRYTGDAEQIANREALNVL